MKNKKNICYCKHLAKQVKLKSHFKIKLNKTTSSKSVRSESVTHWRQPGKNLNYLKPLSGSDLKRKINSIEF